MVRGGFRRCEGEVRSGRWAGREVGNGLHNYYHGYNLDQMLTGRPHHLMSNEHNNYSTMVSTGLTVLPQKGCRPKTNATQQKKRCYLTKS